MPERDPFEALEETFSAVDEQKQDIAEQESVLNVELSAAEATVEGLKRQLADKEGEALRLDRQLISANANFVSSVPDLGELAVAVFQIKLPDGTEKIQNDPYEFLKILSGIRTYWKQLVNLEHTFTAAEEPVPVMAARFWDIHLAEGGDTVGPMRYEDIRGQSLTLGIVPPQSKFTIETETVKPGYGFSSYPLPSAVTLAVNDQLKVSTAVGGWDYSYRADTWLVPPEPSHSNTARLDILRKSNYSKPLAVDEIVPTDEIDVRANYTQLIVGEDLVVSALERIKAERYVDSSPLDYAHQHLKEIAKTS